MGSPGRPGVSLEESHLGIAKAVRGTTEGTWPYAYSECDAGITPNQSGPDGISFCM